MPMHIARNSDMRMMVKPPQAQRAFDKVKDACAAQGMANDKDIAYALGILGTKARQAKARAPKMEKRKMVRKTLKAAGEIGKTKSDWMREADKWFSRFIRLRDSDGNGNAMCVTCGKFYTIQEIECGHWIRRAPPKGSWGTRYEEHNAHSQGACCNRFDYGAEKKHEEKIIEMYGREEVWRLFAIARKEKQKPSAKGFQFFAEKYEKKVAELGGWPLV